MSSAPELAPAPPLDATTGGGGGAPFTIAASPFTAPEPVAGGVADAPVASQPPSLPVEAAEDAAGGKRSRSEDGEQPVAASILRPPRPPQLDVSHAIAVSAAVQAKGMFRSPRGSSGSLPSPGGSGRRRQSSKMQGRVCIECGTTSTTQWRSQGLLCNGCGVKLIKGRLPMDADSMQRRWLRLPPAIRDHPMWAAAQVVAEAQTKASRAAAAGEPWTCPGCGCASSDRVAGPCGLQFCAANCAGRYTGRSPPGGAVAVAAAVTAPPAGAVAAAAAALGGNPSPTPSPTPAQKRRKQATPRSAADSLLSPLSLDSSGDDSSSMQAYSWQSAREADDAATSMDVAGATPGSRPASTRRQRSGQRSAAAATPPGSAKKAVTISTPTAAEAAAALLVLTESEELRIAADEHAAAIAEAARAAKAAAEAAAAAKRAPQPPAAAAAAAADVPAAVPAGEGAKAARCAVATSLDLVMQMLRQNSGLPLPAATAAVVPPAALPVDSVALYQQLITASATPEGAAAGLTGELVGKYLAAHTAPGRALAAAGGAGACGDGVASAIRAQQDQQARLVAAMVAEKQHEAAVALMKSVVQLAGLD